MRTGKNPSVEETSEDEAPVADESTALAAAVDTGGTGGSSDSGVEPSKVDEAHTGGPTPAGTKPAPRRRARRQVVPQSRSTYSKDILWLEKQLQRWEKKVGVLEEQQSLLAARFQAAHVAVVQCLAMLELGTLLQEQQLQEQQRQQLQEQHLSPSMRPSVAAAAGGRADWLFPDTASHPGWQAHMIQMRQQLDGLGDLSMHVACRPNLGWSPAAAAAFVRQQGSALDLSTTALRRALRRFTEQAGHLYMWVKPVGGWMAVKAACLAGLPPARLQILDLSASAHSCNPLVHPPSAAPATSDPVRPPPPPNPPTNPPTHSCDNVHSKARSPITNPEVEEARRQLEAERAAVLELSCLIILSANPSPCSEILLSSMDHDTQPPQPPPTSPEWMVWLVQQLELDPAQVRVLEAGGRGWEGLDSRLIISRSGITHCM